MATNYFVQPPGACRTRCSNWIHLGKQSAGWVFAFRGYQNGDLADTHLAGRKVTTISEWCDLAVSGQIYDEYNKPVSMAEMMTMIARHGNGKVHFGGDWVKDGAGNEFHYGEFS